MYESVDDILDDKPKLSPAMEAFKWWERKRLWYNGILLLTGLVSMLMLSPPIDNFLVFGVIAWGLFANLCYSIGFMIEMINLHYLKGRYNMQGIRLTLFVLGTGLSVMATFFFPFLVYFPVFMF
jgi:hypothetical protein